MTTKTKQLDTRPKSTQALAATGYKKSSIEVAVAPGSTEEDFAKAVARTLTRPAVTAASVIENWQKDTHDVNVLADELSKQIDAVNGGDLRRAEALLIAQAHTLDNIFSNLARRATNQEYLKQWEAYMRMAMKAQNQCRMTLETLATIKNPPVVFAKQANINNGGQQQVNNGAGPGQGVNPAQACAQVGASAHAAISTSDQTEQLEASDGQRLDTRTASKAGRTDPQVAPVGKVHRAAHR